MIKPPPGTPKPVPVELVRSQLSAIADRLADVREEFRSQEEMAEALGINSTLLCALLKGRAALNVNPAHLDQLAAYFQIDRATLLRPEKP